MVEADPTATKDSIRADANRAMGHVREVDQQSCQQAFRTLKEIHRGFFPQATTIRKDL